MKPPESPRAYPASLAEPLHVEIREEKLVPRYVQAPALRDHGLGPRNLFWGVAMLFVALVLLVIAVFLAGPKAMLYVVTCLVTFTALFVLTRLHIFRQRNGGFLALALVCVIGAGIPLVEKAFEAAKGIVSSQSAQAATATASAPVVTLHSDESQTPLLTQAFALSPPQGAGKQVKVLHDSPVVIEGKHFLIKAGDRFPYVASKGEETMFAVRDLQVALPNNAVDVVDPSTLAKGVSGNPLGQAQAGTTAKDKDAKSATGDAELAEITHSAQQEAMRRYPALAIKDSLENAVYISTYKQLRDAGSDEFFAKPEWPIVLADLLAQREGWVRGGAPMTTGPAPVLDPPPTPDNAADNNPPPRAQSVRPSGNLPPVESLDAGADLPGGGRGR